MQVAPPIWPRARAIEKTSAIGRSYEKRARSGSVLKLAENRFSAAFRRGAVGDRKEGKSWRLKFYKWLILCDMARFLLVGVGDWLDTREVPYRARFERIQDPTPAPMNVPTARNSSKIRA